MLTFFDHQTFSLQTFGGISRYFTELITGINKTEIDEAYISLLLSENIHLREAGIKAKISTENVSIYKKIQVSYKINQIYSILKLKQKKFDVFHPTYYDPYFIPYLKGKPFVVTFLDMIHEKFSGKFSGLNDGGIITEQKRVLAKKADKIIAISESTKRDIIDILDIDPNKIEVIYLGSSFERSVKSAEKQAYSNNPYLLYVGRRDYYKNFEGMLRSIENILINYKIELVCAGGGGFSKEELLMINSLGLIDRVKYVSIDDGVLKQLYEGAIAFIFPSMYEGFGIPILEAFANGCPCITSNMSSLPEVAGDAALYIEPTSKDSINTCVERIINDNGLRNLLIEKGYRQLESFSWNKTINQTVNVYKSLAN